MTGSRPLLVRLVAAGLVVVCAAVFLHGVRQGAFQATRHGLRYVSVDRSDHRVLVRNRIEEIRRQFADSVPAGSRIRIVAPSEFGTVWYLRLSEIATLNRVLVTEPTDPTGSAEFTVAVIEDGSGPYGVRLVVERVR